MGAWDSFVAAFGQELTKSGHTMRPTGAQVTCVRTIGVTSGGATELHALFTDAPAEAIRGALVSSPVRDALSRLGQRVGTVQLLTVTDAVTVNAPTTAPVVTAAPASSAAVINLDDLAAKIAARLIGR